MGSRRIRRLYPRRGQVYREWLKTGLARGGALGGSMYDGFEWDALTDSSGVREPVAAPAG
jgi:hypothetical protein